MFFLASALRWQTDSATSKTAWSHVSTAEQSRAQSSMEVTLLITCAVAPRRSVSGQILNEFCTSSQYEARIIYRCTYVTALVCCLRVRAPCNVDLLGLDHIKLCIGLPFEAISSLKVALPHLRIINRLEAVQRLIAQLCTRSGRSNSRVELFCRSHKISTCADTVSYAL